MRFTVVLAVAAAWVVVGALLGLRESRRGHWHWMWLLGAFAGPFGLPLFRQIEQNESQAITIALSSSDRDAQAGLKVLVGVDGSDVAVDAAKNACALLGSRIGDVTVALVADFEVTEFLPADFGGDMAKDHESGRELALATEQLGSWLGFVPSSVLLSGRPATALHDYASRSGHDVIAVGTTGRGLAKRLVGSCARQLVEKSKIPVIVIPSGNDSPAPD